MATTRTEPSNNEVCLLKVKMCSPDIIQQSQDSVTLGLIDNLRLWGVKLVASKDRNLRVICKLRRQAPQIRLSQRAEPSPLWRCRFRKIRMG